MSTDLPTAAQDAVVVENGSARLYGLGSALWVVVLMAVVAALFCSGLLPRESPAADREEALSSRTPAPPRPAGPASTGPDPAALLRDRRYVLLDLLGAVIGVPVAVFSYFFMKTVERGEPVLLHRLAPAPRIRGRAHLVATPSALRVRPARGTRHPVPAGHRGALAGRRVQAGWRRRRHRAARHPGGGAGHALSGRRPRPRSAAHRPRERSRGALPPPRETRRRRPWPPP